MTHCLSIHYESIKNYALMYGKKITRFVLSFFLFLILYITYYNVTLNKFVYVDRDKDIVYTEQRHIPILVSEKKIAYLVRTYLAGSLDYKGRVPFSEKTRLQHVSYNKYTKDLILDWDIFFYNHMLDSIGQIDMTVFLETIKLNTDVKVIYFLVEGKQIPMFFKNSSLSQGYKLNKF